MTININVHRYLFEALFTKTDFMIPKANAGKKLLKSALCYTSLLEQGSSSIPGTC